MKNLLWFIVLLVLGMGLYSLLSSKTEESGNTPEATSPDYTVLADLTIRDKTQEIEFGISKSKDGRYQGIAYVDRTLFDVKFGSTKFFSGLGDNVVDDIFSVNFDLALASKNNSSQVQLDIEKSTLTWEGKKTLIATWKDSGSIKLKSGFINFDDTGVPIGGEAVIDMTTIQALNTGRGAEEKTTNMLTKHLSSDDFFNVEVYPTAILKIKSITKYVAEEDKPDFVYQSASADKITVELPFPGAVTGKEFSVIGKARGSWYFEASFPIDVLDKDGAVLAQGYATAQGEWMTTEFVPFKGDIKIPDSYIGPATLVLKYSNASGEPERDASVSFPFTIEY